jgi:GAF domain-containing protein
MDVSYFAETKGVVGCLVSGSLAFKVRDWKGCEIEFLCEYSMTHKPEDGALEEIILPENLLPLGSVLTEGVTPLDVSTVLAKVFHVQRAEVALLRLEGGLLKFIIPDHLRTTGAIPISSKAVAAHTALSKKAEIFNNFARVKHASIFETIKPVGVETDQPAPPAPIQKLMSVPILDQQMSVIGVIQISRKGTDPRHTQDFSREDLHDLETAAGLLAASPVMQAN